MQVCRATGVQRHRCVGMQVGRSAGAQGCKGAGFFLSFVLLLSK